MRFFEDQRIAKRNTIKLMVLFTLAVLLISALTSLTIGYVLFNHHPPQSFVTGVFTLVLLVVGGASLLRSWQLKSGATIATMLGGTEVNRSSADAKINMLYNITEEMSIAAGISTPRLYLLPSEQGINAFAAGFSTENAVIGVTQGALKHLSRDELQALIGHEMSHILNGDMLLNIRLAGTIFGLIMISRLGKILTDTRKRRISRNQRNPLIPIGFVLYIFGSLGVFFARIIQSQISKQREYLADASAAQFTRNPTSLAAVLSKIYFHYPSVISEPNSIELSHMFFNNAHQHSFFKSWFATHPPILDRVNRLLPNIKKSDTFAHMQELSQNIAKTTNSDEIKMASALANTSSLALAEAPSSDQAPLAAATENLSFGLAASVYLANTQVRALEARIQSMPGSLKAILQTPERCVGALKTLLNLDSDKAPASDARQAIMEFISKSAANKIILLQMLLNTLRVLPKDHKAEICRVLEQDALNDKKISTAEMMVILLTHSYLLTNEGPEKKSNLNIGFAKAQQGVLVALQAVCAFDDNGDEVSRQQAEKINTLTISQFNLRFEAPKEPLSFQQISEALGIVKLLSINYKESFISLLWKCLQLNETSDSKLGLVRVLCMIIQVPVPLIMQASIEPPNQRLRASNL